MRKKILLLTLISTITLTLSAQLEKGSIYPNITIGKRIIKFSTYSVRPSVSMAISERSSLGIFYDYTRYRHVSSPSFTSSYSHSQSVGINYTYFHFFKNSKKWGWTLGADASYGKYSNFEYKPTEGKYVRTHHLDTWDLVFVPGAFYKLSNRMMLQGNIGGFSLKGTNGNWFTLRSDFATQLNLGLRFKLGRK